MGNSESVWWIVVELSCRILGVSTATVLCAVGVETIQLGEFTSLGIYLLVSSFAIMMFELTYFLHALLSLCLPCPPDWQLFVLWGKMARIGGFHKFLYYSIMSLVCFLHPVLVWHAIIPGTMLLVTAFFNFILSKKTKKTTCSKSESYSDQGPTTVCVSQTADLDSTVPFFHTVIGRRGGGLVFSTRDRCLSQGERGESVQAMLELEQTAAPKDTDTGRWGWKERRLISFRGREEPVEREMEELDGYCEPEADTTSDTAPMITD